jgi:hypothetical protein
MAMMDASIYRGHKHTNTRISYPNGSLNSTHMIPALERLPKNVTITQAAYAPLGPP